MVLGASHRVVLRRLTIALLGCAAILAVSAPTAAADQAEWLYDPNTVVEIDLGLSQANFDELEAEPEEYVKGTFQAKVDGMLKGPALTDVGIRLKGGAGSKRKLTEKAAFKVKFDKFVKGQLYFGLEGITLNNMVQDESMIHEALTYDLFRAMDVPAPRTGYAFTRLNGEVIGVHANVEQYDDISLPVLWDSTQHLYEADVFNVDVVPGGEGTFEVDQGDDEDLSDLEALIAAANDEVGDWSDGMAAVADLEEMTRMWAVERYVGHWDGYAGGASPPDVRPNNYYLHSDDAGIFQMAPWGTDQTWEDHLGFDEEAGGLMFNKCFADASCKALYDEALEGIQQVTATLELKSKAKRYAALLAPCQALEVEPRREHTAGEIAAEVQVAQEFVEERYIPLQIYLENTPPALQPETASPPTEEPCTPDPPEKPAPPADGPPAAVCAEPPPCTGPAPKQFSLRIRKTRVIGSLVKTQMTAPGAGKGTQTVKAKSKGKWKVACKGQKARGSSGPLTVSCRLAPWARGLAKSKSLRLKVRVGFDPRAGKAKFLSRTVTLPKLG